MQSLSRALSSLTGSSAVRWAGLRALASSAADAGAPEGVKAILLRLLRSADGPKSSAELWELAEPEGLKSKRHMKQMLAQMKSKKQVVTRPLNTSSSKRARSYGYALPEVLAQQARQQRQRQQAQQ